MRGKMKEGINEILNDFIAISDDINVMINVVAV